MPPNNSRAFDDLEESERVESSNDSNSTSSSSEEESTVKDKSSDLDEKTTESEVTSSSGDSSSEEDDSKSNENDKAPTRNKTAMAACAAACIYALEKCRQKKLTKVPLVMGQFPQDSQIKAICQKLTDDSAILSQPIVPSMFVGTHGQLASTAAFMNPGPKRLRYSETFISSFDGAELCLDWDISNNNSKDEIACISRPTVLILHGINNSSDYGYIKSLQKTMTDRGWNAVAMNFRGTAKGGRQRMTTPRSYTASYTGDLRSVVNQLSKRIQHNSTGKTSNGCLVLVGNSLGGIIVTKYLGEEGLAGTLPKKVLGGISLGNPFAFFANHIAVPFGQMIGAARKFNYFCQQRPMSMNHNQHSPALELSKLSLASLDSALAPTMVRTAPHPPFNTKIGYGHAKHKEEDTAAAAAAAMSAAEEYWIDTGCYKQGRHVSVPLLHVMARDDTLCFGSARLFLNYALRNPNVMVVQTRTGGHLGWWHSTNKKAQSWLGLDSWTDGATADFIQAVLDTHQPSSHATNSAPIEDAHNLFAPTNPMGSSDESRKTKSSMQALPGDRDGDSTIASKDPTSYNDNRPQTTISDARPSKTYVQFQQVLLMQRQSEEQEQIKFLERNRLVEKRESIELSLKLQSRL